jgi:hypothetical protein
MNLLICLRNFLYGLQLQMNLFFFIYIQHRSPIFQVRFGSIFLGDTCYYILSRKQSWLDYFLISSDLEGFIKCSEIGLSYRSDHSPVSVSFQFHNQERGRGTWKFNNSLLYDPDYVTLMKNCIHEAILITRDKKIV